MWSHSPIGKSPNSDSITKWINQTSSLIIRVFLKIYIDHLNNQKEISKDWDFIIYFSKTLHKVCHTIWIIQVLGDFCTVLERTASSGGDWPKHLDRVLCNVPCVSI